MRPISIRRVHAPRLTPEAARDDAHTTEVAVENTRRSELARLVPLWPHEIADMSPAGRARVIAHLERALRAERRRGLAAHWTYNLARHVQLLRAYRAEKEAARALTRPPRRGLGRIEAEKRKTENRGGVNA